MLERPSKLVSYRFDQLADQINDRVMPDEADVDRYVGLEHLDPDSLRIRRWGDTSEVESTKLLFKPGDIIFGKRRVYQRKVAVADFEGICSAHTPWCCGPSPTPSCRSFCRSSCRAICSWSGH